MPIISDSGDLIAVITAAASAVTGLLIAIRYSRCKEIRCWGMKCIREVTSPKPPGAEVQV